jgi:predicted nucleic acid-binding protein
MMTVYLDNCMFNRPFDAQDILRVRLETEAKLHIQEQIKRQQLKLVWSYILDFENAQNPFAERRQAIACWRRLSFRDISVSPSVLTHARALVEHGIKAKDALHAACAIEAQCDYFLTTDDRLLKRLTASTMIAAMNPVDFIKVLES